MENAKAYFSGDSPLSEKTLARCVLFLERQEQERHERWRNAFLKFIHDVVIKVKKDAHED